MRVAHRIHDLAVDRYGLEPERPHLRRPHLPALHRRRRPARRRHGHHRGHPPHQGRAARRVHHARRVQRELRPQAGGPPRAQLVFLHECVEAGLDSAIVHAARSCRSTASPTSSARSASTSSTTAAGRPRATRRPTTRSSACSRSSRTSRPSTVVKEDRSGWPVEQRLSQRIIDGDRDGLTDDLDEALAGGHHPARHHQRRAAGRHEGGRRAVRLRRDAAAVRAAVGRDHEDGRRLPRAVHGEGRRRRQGPHRARHRQGRRARHRQEPRRHHPHQQRLRGAQPRHQGARSPR